MPSVAERVLVGVLVYNGRDFVPRCLESAARLQHSGTHEVDVLVLDDCSPEPGWSEQLEKLADRLAIQYYRSPRNLGIPRNMNLALLRGVQGGYDFVLLANSDIVVPENLIDAMVRCARTSDDISSVTAMSNSVSIFSLPNADPAVNVSHQGAVDFLSAALNGEFAAEVVDVPTAVGFCMLIPTAIVRDIGLLDPIFGRGYCEEVEWSLRSHQRGYRSVLAPGSFVYHVGNATTREAGLLQRGHFTSWQNEAIVDMRYPSYRDELAAFDRTSPIRGLHERSLQAIVVCAAREWGYTIEAGWLHRENSRSLVQFVVEPDGTRPLLTGRFQGFGCGITLDDDDVVGTIEALVGKPPSEVSVLEQGRVAAAMRAQASTRGIPVREISVYPQRV
jgi:GT2 family glycosyltransferase